MNPQSKALKWSLIIGIVIVLNLFFNYTLSLVYKQPDFNTFCPITQVVEEVKTQNECVAKGGQWNGNTYGAPVDVTNPKVTGYCDLQFTCRQNYDAANKVFDRNLFVTLVVLGALSVLIANFFKGNAVISAGLSFGGVLSFVIASMRYWSNANDILKVGILGVALVLLFWIATKKFKD